MKSGRQDRSWEQLDDEVVCCTRCSRLVEHCREVARVRRRAFIEQTYWGRPVPGFGDRRAGILFLGLAPAAHGANRTGRMFTGDSSGDWLYRAMNRAGLASQDSSTAVDDGLRLKGAYISAVCRCAPPSNRPTTDEMRNCAPFLDREIDLLKKMSVIVALGGIAWAAALRRVRRLAEHGLPRPQPKFSHGAQVALPLGPGTSTVWLLGSYHPSRQNTQTRRLTRPMLDSVIRRAVRLAQDRGSRAEGRARG